MEKNLVLKLKGNIINNTVERLGYINGVFCSNSETITSEVVLVKMELKNSSDTITFRKLSGDITFYKGTSFDSLTEIEEDIVELTSNISNKSLYIKGTTDVFYMKPSLGSRIEIGPASNILSFGTTFPDWSPISLFLTRSDNTAAVLKLLVESSNLLECEYLRKINAGVIVNITDILDITELKLDNFQGNIVTSESEVELNKLINEDSLNIQILGNLFPVEINDKKVYEKKPTSVIYKINLTGNNYNINNIEFPNNSKVSYSGTEEDYPFRGNKTSIANINFIGDDTNFDTFFKALTKYNTIRNINVNNVIITDASNSAIEQLKTKVTGVFLINGINKKA